jgi:hypothetical protein
MHPLSVLLPQPTHRHSDWLCSSRGTRHVLLMMMLMLIANSLFDCTVTVSIRQRCTLHGMQRVGGACHRCCSRLRSQSECRFHENDSNSAAGRLQKGVSRPDSVYCECASMACESPGSLCNLLALLTNNSTVGNGLMLLQHLQATVLMTG